MGADLGVVEAVESEREMIQVAAPGSRRCAAHRAELARDGDKIDQGVTGAKLIEADLRLLALIGAAENLLVEAAHPVEVDDAQHDTVEAMQRKGRRIHERLLLVSATRSPARRGPSSRRGRGRRDRKSTRLNSSQ